MDKSMARWMPWWSWAWPLLAWAVLIGTMLVGGSAWPATLARSVAAIAVVFAAVFHAEVVAHRLGEPFGTLVLALAVTVIEVALIVSVMLGGGASAATLARDTVFATVMITLNGLVGMCLLVGGARHHEQGFQAQGASAALAVLAAIMTLTLVLPNYTSSAPGPVFTAAQLCFAGFVSLVLYSVFIFVQTVRHRDYFLPDDTDEASHAPPPSNGATLLSAVLLIVSLVAVVGLAKALTPALDAGVARMGAPVAVVGVVIALLVLMPEGLAAMAAARQNRLQTSMNLILGSALATIGLTIPAVAVVAIALDQPLSLGLGAKEQILLALTLLVGVMTLGTGRTTVLQGAVHLMMLASFLFLSVVP